MKKLFYAALSACLLAGAIGCSDDYDDSALWDKVNGIDGDIENIKTDLEALKAKVQGLNDTYAALTAMLNGGIITAAESVTDEKTGRTGYKFTVTTKTEGGGTSSTDYFIWNGTDGQDGETGAAGADGTTPQLAVAKDEATGRYYWTLNGEALTDDSGNKIWATGENGADGEDGTPGTPGTNGKDGVTPQLKIGESTSDSSQKSWFVSYDNGDTWTEVGVFSGDVSTSNISVSVADGVVTIKQDGQADIQIPIVEANNLKITIAGLDESNTAHVGRGRVYTFSYTLEGASENAVVKAELLNGAGFSIENVPADKAIKITTGDAEASDVVLVHVYDGKVCAHTSFNIISDLPLATIQNAVTVPLYYAATTDFVYTGSIKLDKAAAKDIAIALTAGETTLPEGSYEIKGGTIAAGATEGTYTVTIKRSAVTLEAGDYTLPLSLAVMEGIVVLDKNIVITVTDQPGKMNYTVEQVICNATETSEGPLPNVCDGNLTNYWHSPWSASVATDSTYGVMFDVTLDRPVYAVYFKYYARPSNNNVVPTGVAVGLSSDGSTWTLAGTEETGLTTANTNNNTKSYSLPDAQPINAIRFGITSSVAGSLLATSDGSHSTALAELEAYVLY